MKKYFAFAECLGTYDNKICLPETCCEGELMAGFLIVLGAEYDYKPSQRKSTSAALKMVLQQHQKPDLYQFSHIYPLTHQALDVWHAEQKKIPITLKEPLLLALIKSARFSSCQILILKSFGQKQLQFVPLSAL